MTHHGRVYCAGPLFNKKEREEMEELASALETEGYATFLPQRDGLELTRCVEKLVELGYSSQHANRVMSEAIFALDVYQVLSGCDAVVTNLNGRVPDEGAVSEVAMAWARGKVVVGYKSDSRSAFGGQDNPLVAGLFGFQLCRTIPEVVVCLQEKLESSEKTSRAEWQREEEISSYSAMGSAIWRALQEDSDIGRLVEVIVQQERAAAPSPA